VDRAEPKANNELPDVASQASAAKVAIEGLPASESHIEVYDILGELETVESGGRAALLEKLARGLVNAPGLTKVVGAEFDDSLIPSGEGELPEKLGALERMLERHGALDVDDLERQTGRLADQIEHLGEELARVKLRSDMSVRMSNIFAFIAIVLALLLLVSGLVTDSMSVDLSTSSPIFGAEENP
jgi:hypothetical protein